MFNDLPKSLIDAAAKIQRNTETISELKLNKNFNDLDSVSKDKVRKLAKKAKPNQMIVLDLETQNILLIDKDEFDKGLFAIIGEKKENNIEQEKKRTSHSSDPQLDEMSENFVASKEPNSAVGHRRGPDIIKHADVIFDTKHVGGVVEQGYRLLLYRPNISERAGGSLEIFPPTSMSPAKTLEELSILCQILSEKDQEVCEIAISRARDLPYKNPLYSGSTEENVDEIKESYEKMINEGAASGILVMPGKFTKKRVESEVKKIIRKAKKEHKNDPEAAYSGDWNTINDVKFDNDENVFIDFDSAKKNALIRAEKNSHAFAVKFIDDDKKKKWLVAAWLAT